MNSSSSIILLYGRNNMKKSIFPSAAVCKVGLVSDYLVIHPVIYKLLAHSSVQREKWSIKSIQCSVLTVWILLREKNVAFNILAPRCWRNTVWSRAGDTDTHVNLLLLNASTNSHGEDLWTSLSPTATSHQHSLPAMCQCQSNLTPHTICCQAPQFGIRRSAGRDQTCNSRLCTYWPLLLMLIGACRLST